MYVRLFHARRLHRHLSIAKLAPAASLAALMTATTALAQDAPGSHDATDPPAAPEAPATPTPPQADGERGAGDAAPATSQADGERAAPDAPGSTEGDVVYLTDGRVLRGTIVETTPDVEVRIRLATGEVVTVARREIRHFEHTAPALEAEPSTGLRAPYPQAGWVHIEGSDAATLEHAARDRGWTAVCSSPCDKAVPTGGVYRIVGPDLKTSNAFSLSVRNGEYETLRVHGASPSATTSGIVILAVGIPLSVSAAFAVVGYSALGSGGPLSPTARTIEQTSILAGAIATLVGVGMLVTNLSTGVSQSVVGSPPSTPPGSPYGGPLPAPYTSGWRAASPEGARIPSAVGTPLLRVRF
jgi:hypothetical protein